MLKQLYELVKELLGLSQDVRRHDVHIKELQAELKAVVGAVRELAFEVRRMRENEVHEREKMALRLENTLLRSGRDLIAGETDSATAPTEAD